MANIGNGFIDKGARALIQSALPDANIIEVSGYPNLVATRRKTPTLPTDFGRRFSNNLQQNLSGSGGVQQNPLNIAELTDVDLAVLPGCTLYEHVLEPYRPVLERLHENDVPLILLGSGGGDYNPDTRKYVEEQLNYMEPAALITRDSTAFQHYAHLAEIAHDGIDCAFFIDEWHTPPKSTKPVTALTFDKIPEPSMKFDSEKQVFRPCHTPHGITIPFDRPLRRLNQYRNTRNPFQDNDRFVSDILTDYLFIYGNAEQTHSDRIHACVPALVYGNEAQFYYETPRAKLFDRVLDEDIQSSTVSLDKSKLEDMKKSQVEAFREAVRTHTSDPS